MLYISCTRVNAILRTETAVCSSLRLVQRTMMENFCEVVNNYEKRLQDMSLVPRSSYGHPMLREDNGPNRNFLTYVFCYQDFAMQFLKNVSLLRSKVQCNTCDRDMTWSAEPTIPHGFRWRRRKKVAGVKCPESRSVKHGSSFQYSHLTFHEILLITMTSCAANMPTISKNNMWSWPYFSISYFRYGRVYVVCYRVVYFTSHLPPNTVTDITLSLMLPALAAIMSPRL